MILLSNQSNQQTMTFEKIVTIFYLFAEKILSVHNSITKKFIETIEIQSDFEQTVYRGRN